MRSPWTQILQKPVRNLISIFAFWKLGLLLLAAFSPGPGYDTSASLSLHVASDKEKLPFLIRHIAEKLTRWDAIYFTQISRRGYIYEQDWAFGWGFTRLIALCTAGLKSIGVPSMEGIENIVGIGIAHIAHFLSVVTLFYLTLAIFPGEGPEFAFGAALLHIISPAGIFLSAPYAESSCAFLTFVGCLVFAKSFGVKESIKQDARVLLSGLLFGIATTFRSNGCLNGLLLLEEAFRTLWKLQNNFQLATIRHLLATGIGGLFVAAGLVMPQYLAYHEYCGRDLVVRRPWCTETVPSIYKFVQSHYWNVGLFRYWVLPNLPLFLLAAPMLTLVVASGIWALLLGRSQRTKVIKSNRESKKGSGRIQILHNLAVSQLLLAVLTLTTAHVQIITRISSSNPVWVWYTAMQCRNKNSRLSEYIVRFMVVYGIVQAGLYSSFLPPA